MGPVGLRGIKFTRSGLKECGTCRLQVPLEHAPAVVQENPEGLPERILGTSTFNKGGDLGSELAEDKPCQGSRAAPV